MKTHFVLQEGAWPKPGRGMAQDPEAIHDEIYSEFAGWTVEGTVKGAYRMKSGQKKVEDLLKVSIILLSSQLSRLETMIAVWAEQLGQETMLLKVSDFNAKFISPSEEGTK